MMDMGFLQRIKSTAAQEGLLRHFPALFLSFGIAAQRSTRLTEALHSHLRRNSHDVLDAIGNLLREEQVVCPWGDALAIDRAKVLANWIAPHVTGESVLDLLCGDGAVGNQLGKACSANVHLVERQFQRGVMNRDWIRDIEDFETFITTHESSVKHDTILLCTVLHHETDPVQLLELAAQRAARRILIVENCIEEVYEADYHLLVDAIFNCSLYRTQLPIPGQHRTAHEWRELCEKHGRVSQIHHTTKVPGIPLGHTLMVVDLEDCS